MRNPPLDGSAALATSGTSRIDPDTPVPVCQEGRLKCRLGPPPLAPLLLFQTTSLLGARCC